MSTGDWQRLDWGLLDYGEALRRMRELHAQRVAGLGEDVIICVEHPRVFTMGRDADRDNILLSDAELEDQGITVHWIERKGDVFYHGPGLATIYPIIDLRARRIAVHALVDAVEDALVEAARSYGVQAMGDPERRGAWLGERKVGAIGMALRQKITMHGLGLNVNVDLNDYAMIRTCGLDAPPTSLAHELGEDLDMGQAFDRLYQALAKNLTAAQDTLTSPMAQVARA